MSKKHKSKQKLVRQRTKKIVVPPIAIKGKNGHARPVVNTNVAKSVVPDPLTVKAEPVIATQEHRAEVPFWARMPFAIMDFWFSPPQRSQEKS